MNKNKKVAAEIFFSGWVEFQQKKEFDSEPEFEKFITNLKNLKDSIDCAANGVKKLYKRKGTHPDCKTPYFVSTVCKNESTAILKYKAIIN